MEINLKERDFLELGMNQGGMNKILFREFQRDGVGLVLVCFLEWKWVWGIFFSFSLVECLF